MAHVAGPALGIGEGGVATDHPAEPGEALDGEVAAVAGGAGAVDDDHDHADHHVHDGATAALDDDVDAVSPANLPRTIAR